MAGIVWLASYPKSGNTWLRALLTNLCLDTSTPADINRLHGGPIASARAVFDDAVGVEASDLTPAEIERYRPAVYRRLAAQSDDPLFLKIHDAFTYNPDGYPLIPKEVTQGVLYLIRNPFDVVVSFSHHLHVSVDTAIDYLSNANYSFFNDPSRLHEQLRQRLLTWSGHVRSWVDEPGLRVHVMRYEDMHRRPFETFTSAARFVGLPAAPTRLQRAILFSRFQTLQHQEQEHGFREKPTGVEAFFRQGQVGSWRKVLGPDQVKRIIQDHQPVMQRFGYLRACGEIVY